MPANHDPKARRARVQVKLLQVVDHIQTRSACFQHLRQRKLSRPLLRIDIPRTATTGAISRSRSRISGRPTSPACTMASNPARARSAASRSSPCVSEIKPM
jgi:hypothetical protein